MINRRKLFSLFVGVAVGGASGNAVARVDPDSLPRAATAAARPIRKFPTSQTFRIFLDDLSRHGSMTRAAKVTGVSYNTVRYWLAKSRASPSSEFALRWSGRRACFHEHVAFARDVAVVQIESEVSHATVS